MVWRLLYRDDNRVLDLFETDGFTRTIHNIYDGMTKEECLTKIDELKLTYYSMSGGTIPVLFSGGTRTIIQEE